jgi:hypothetical protein
VGGYLGSMAGNAAGRAVAIQSAGGWDRIKKTSDLSFNTIEDLAVYMYAKHSGYPEYQKVFQLTGEIYPELPKRFMEAIRNASNSPPTAP